MGGTNGYLLFTCKGSMLDEVTESKDEFTQFWLSDMMERSDTQNVCQMVPHLMPLNSDSEIDPELAILLHCQSDASFSP